MANKKLKVRGNYRKRMSDGIGTQLANYEIEIVVANVQPDQVRDAVQAIIPGKVDSYESLQTYYPQHDTVTDTDDKLSVEVGSDGFDPNYGAPKEDTSPREIGPNEGMSEKADAAGTAELQAAANNDNPVEVGDTIPSHPEPGKVYEAPASGDYTQAETLTPDGVIPAGETEPSKDGDDDQPPAPAAQ